MSNEREMFEERKARVKKILDDLEFICQNIEKCDIHTQYLVRSMDFSEPDDIRTISEQKIIIEQYLSKKGEKRDVKILTIEELQKITLCKYVNRQKLVEKLLCQSIEWGDIHGIQTAIYNGPIDWNVIEKYAEQEDIDSEYIKQLRMLNEEKI